MSYGKAGFEVIRGVLEKRTMDLARAAAADLVARYRAFDPRLLALGVSVSEITRHYPDRNPDIDPSGLEGEPFIIGDLLSADGRFWTLIEQAPLWSIAAHALGVDRDSVVFHFSNLTRKPPHVGPALAWHRDCRNTHFAAENDLFMRLLIPLHDMSSDNAGTAFVPGSHRVDADVARQKTIAPDQSAVFTPHVAVGDAIAVHPRVIHGGGANRGTQERDLVVVQFGVLGALLRHEVKEVGALLTFEGLRSARGAS